MQVYKTFFKIARDKLPSILIYFFIFFAIVILLSLTAESDSNSKFEISSVNICMIDHDNSTASQALSDYLTSMHELVTFDSYDNETLQDNLYYQNISYVLTIPDGFEENLLSGTADPLVQTSKRQDSTSGYFVDQQIDSYIRALSLYLTGGADIEEAIHAANSAIADSPDVHSVSFEKHFTEQKLPMYYFFQFIPYVATMMLLEGLAPVLMAFRKKNIGDRINCSSFRHHAKNMQIGFGCMTYSLVIWLAFLVIATAMYGPGQVFSSNGLLCMLNSLIYLLIATTITLIIGTFSMSRNILNMVSNIIGLGMSFLCGVFVPQMYLSDTLLLFSRFLPAYWYVRIINMLGGFSNETLSMDTYWICIGVQLLFFAAFFALYLAVNRQKKKSHA